MKTLEEISLETDIELNFVMFFANQLVSWNLANIIYKFNNYSTFQVSDNFPKDNIFNIFTHISGIIGFNQALSILNSFATSESTTTLNEIYQNYFKSNDNNTFQRNIKFLVEKQYLVQTSIIIYSKLKIKNEFNFKKYMINQIKNSISNKDLIKDDKNKKIEENKNEEDEDNIYYYEDFFIITILKDFIKDKLYINEMSYHTGIKIKDILDSVKKYEYIFDLVVVPLYNVKK